MTDNERSLLLAIADTLINYLTTFNPEANSMLAHHRANVINEQLEDTNEI